MNKPLDMQKRIAERLQASLDPSESLSKQPGGVSTEVAGDQAIPLESIVAFDDLQKKLNAQNPAPKKSDEAKFNKQPLMIAGAMFAMAAIFTTFEFIL